MMKIPFLSSSIVYLISNILNAIIPFSLLPILTRLLSTSEYGQVSIFQTWVTAFTIVVGLNVAPAVARKYYDNGMDNVKIEEYTIGAIQIVGVSYCLVSLSVVLGWGVFESIIKIPLKWLLFASMTTAAGVVINLQLAQWQMGNKPVSYAVMQVGQSLMNMVISLIFVGLLKLGAAGRIDGILVSSIMFCGIALIISLRRGGAKILSWKPLVIRELLTYGVPLIPHVAGGFLLSSVDRLVLNSRLSLSEVGVYAVAMQLTLSLNLVFDAINKAYVPWLFNKLKSNQEIEKIIIVRYTYIWFVVIMIFASTGFLTGPWLLRLVAGSKYSGGGVVIGWLVLGQGLSGMYLMVTNYLFYSKRTGLLSSITLASGGINLILLMLLVPLLGIRGAGIAFTSAMAIEFALVWWAAVLSFPMPWFDPRVFIRTSLSNNTA